MQTWVKVTVTAAALLAALPAAAHGAVVPGEVLVGFERGADAGDRSRARQAVDASFERTTALGARHQVVEVEGSTARAARELQEQPGVAYAHPNYVMDYQAQANDPRTGELYGLQRIAAPAAWDLTTGSKDVRVAVIDSGVNLYHPDLKPNLFLNPGEYGAKSVNGIDDDGNGLVDDWRGWDFADDDNEPNDGNIGHGTHVAGTIGARGNDGVGIPGINWNVSLLPIRVGHDKGGVTTETVVEGILYAGKMGARVANISIGGAASGPEPVAYREAFRASPNTLFVISAGNDGKDTGQTAYYPCNYSSEPNVVCVAATDDQDALADFSNFGPTVELAAPGKDILSANPRYLLQEDFEDLRGEWQPITGTGPNHWGLTTELAASGQYSLTDSPGTNAAAFQDNMVFRSKPFSTERPDPWGEHAECILDFKLIQRAANFGLPTFNAGFRTEHTGGAFTAHGGTPPAWAGPAPFAGTGWYDMPDIPLGPFKDSKRVELAFSFTSLFGSSVGDGAYVDDIRVWCGSAFGNPPDEYKERSGTSMAAPHVTGVAALVAARRPGASPAELEQALLGGVERVAGLAGKVTTGGRLNAYRALLYPNLPAEPQATQGPQGGDDVQQVQQLPAAAPAAVPKALRDVDTDTRARSARLVVDCPPQQRAACVVQVTGAAVLRGARSSKLKAKRVEVPQGTSRTVSLALPGAAQRELRRRGRLTLKLAVAQDGAAKVTRSVVVRHLARTVRASRAGKVGVPVVWPPDGARKLAVTLVAGRRVVGRASVTPTPGRLGRATVALDRSTRAALRRGRRVRAQLTARAGAGAPVLQRTVTLRG